MIMRLGASVCVRGKGRNWEYPCLAWALRTEHKPGGGALELYPSRLEIDSVARCFGRKFRAKKTICKTGHRRQGLALFVASEVDPSDVWDM